MYEFMMLQNAQMGQFMMQQMMLSSLPQQRSINVTPRVDVTPGPRVTEVSEGPERLVYVGEIGTLDTA